MAKAQASTDATTTAKVRELPAILKDLRAGEKISMAELEIARKAGHTDLWIRHELEYGRKEWVEVDMDEGEDVTVDPKTGEQLVPMELVFINGIRIRVPKGVQVEVSYLVADILRGYKRHRRSARQKRSINITNPGVQIG